MISAQFGYVTAGFTVGGFLASLTISPLKGRFSILQRSRNVLLMAAVWNLLGGLIQMMAASWPILALGRFFMGLGSGIALAVVPPYLK
jgi:predicted MFS family arabinose efflux permease